MLNYLFDRKFNRFDATSMLFIGYGFGSGQVEFFVTILLFAACGLISAYGERRLAGAK